MALIKCKECEKDISDKAGTVCPSCGHVVEKKIGMFELISTSLSISFILSIILYFTKYYNVTGEAWHIESYLILIGVNAGITLIYFFLSHISFVKYIFTNIISAGLVAISYVVIFQKYSDSTHKSISDMLGMGVLIIVALAFMNRKNVTVKIKKD